MSRDVKDAAPPARKSRAGRDLCPRALREDIFEARLDRDLHKHFTSLMPRN
jgi:hypothetical protein